jgi:phosphate transport system substrate-binding protein
LAKKNTGKEPKEWQVGIDALAIAVHPNNPLESISIAELAEIYGENGTAQKWSDLGVENKACADGGIIMFGRQNSSGTYQYFKEAILGEKGEYRQGISQQSGSSEVVEVISTTPCGIGYTGMGYLNSHVKVVGISKEKGGEAIKPTLETASDGSYLISRPLFIYTLGDPSPSVQALLDWVMSDEGQQVVTDMGYVPMPKKPASSASAGSNTPAESSTPAEAAPASNDAGESAAAAGGPADEQK